MSLAAVSATAARAAVAVFDFGVGPDGVVTSTWSGDETATHTFTADGQSLIATAFGPGTGPGGSTLDDLFGKNLGGDETGLGMTNDPSGEDEIYFGKGFIQLDVHLLSGALQLAFDSTTDGEQWVVYGDNTPGLGGSGVLQGTGAFIGANTSESATLNLTGGYKYYDIFSGVAAGGANGGNVLIKSLTVTSVPEPATWGLMIVGVLGVGAVLRQRRRSALSAA